MEEMTKEKKVSIAKAAAKKPLALSEIIFLALICLVFAGIYLGAVYLITPIGTALAPLGLQQFGTELIFGIWFMAAIFAGYVLQRPGIALIAEMLAALLEVLMGNFYGPIVFVSGFVQGVGAELGFAAFKYRRYDWVSCGLGALLCTVFSFAWGFYRSGFLKISADVLFAMFCVRLLSSLFFSLLITKLTADRLARSGVLRSFALGRQFSAADHA